MTIYYKLGLRLPRVLPHPHELSHVLALTLPRHTYRLLRQILQKGSHLAQLVVRHVVDERRALDSVSRLELEAHRRVIDDHDRAQVATQQSEVLHKHAVGNHAVIAEQTVGDEAFRIHLSRRGSAYDT